MIRITFVISYIFLGLGLYSHAQKIMLPVEVLGAEGTIEERSFTLTTDQLAKTNLLWLQVNNLGYQNKASIKMPKSCAFVAIPPSPIPSSSLYKNSDSTYPPPYK